MCNTCAERALKLRSIALDFRVTARLGPHEIAEKLSRTADELEAFARNLLHPGQGTNECDVVWADEIADEADEPRLAQCT